MIVSVIGLALLDCLNPATIATMAVLLPLVKKVHHALFFLGSTFITYYLGGLILYFGVDQFLSTFFTRVFDQYANIIFFAEVALGILLFGVSLAKLIQQVKSRHWIGKKQDPSATIEIKTLHPFGIFMFGVGSTISDLPTAFPLLILIGRLSETRPSMIDLLILLFLYVLIYVFPLILLYAIFLKTQQKMKALGVWFQKAIHAFNTYALFPLLILLGGWLIYDGLSNLG